MHGRWNWSVAGALAAIALGCSAAEPFDVITEGVGGIGGSGTAGGPCFGSPTASFQQGMPLAAPYTGATDTTLFQSAPDTNAGLEASCIVGTSRPRECLLRWDISSIPAGKTVTDACIGLTVTNTSSSLFTAFQLERQWSQSSATWNNATVVNLWGAPGASASSDRGVDVASFYPANGGTQWMPLSVTLVQSWITNPSTNDGIIFAVPATVSNGMSLATAEEPTVAWRPQLHVVYH